MVRQRLRWSARGQRIRRPHGSRSTDSSRPKLMRRKPWMQVSSLTISPALVFATSATAEGNGCRRPLSARVSQIVNRRSRLLLVRCEEYLVSAGSTVPLAPQALRPLAVQPPPLIEQQLMRPAIAPPRPPPRDPAQLRPQRLIMGSDVRLMTLRRAVLTNDSARPPLRDPQAVLQHQDRLAPARRAHQFPFAISFNAATSSV
jgi:hypothetical protein